MLDVQTYTGNMIAEATDNLPKRCHMPDQKTTSPSCCRRILTQRNVDP